MARCLTVVALLAAAGCASKPAIELVPCKATVTFHGKPATGLIVYLKPTDGALAEKLPMAPRGVVASDGAVDLGTFVAGDGLPPGEYTPLLCWPKDRLPPEAREAFDSGTDMYKTPLPALTITRESTAIPPFALD